MKYLHVFSPSVVVIVLAASVPSHGAQGPSSSLPRPKTLEPNVRFWTNIFGKIPNSRGLIHDDRYLNIVYNTVKIPPKLSGDALLRFMDQTVDTYRRRLLEALSTPRDSLSDATKKMLKKWPRDISDAALQAAAQRIHFQRGQSTRFRYGLRRSRTIKPYVRDRLASNSMPPQLAALPHVESAYDPMARSHLGAVGLWQIITKTGMEFLKIDSAIDQRLDPCASTEAALELLQQNYEELGTWPLAITAYNHGRQGMKRAVAKMGTTDIGVIVTRYRAWGFGFASRNFYSELLAAWEVSEHPERYFPGFSSDIAASATGGVVLDAYYDVREIASLLGIGIAELRGVNPALKESVWMGAKYAPKGYWLRLPPQCVQAGTASQLADQIATSDSLTRYDEQRPDTEYRVRPGDALSRIARKYEVSERAIMAVNEMRHRNRLIAGHVIKLPVPNGSVTPGPAKASTCLPTQGNANTSSNAMSVEAGEEQAENSKKPSSPATAGASGSVSAATACLAPPSAMLRAVD